MKRLYLGFVCILGLGFFSSRMYGMALRASNSVFHYGADRGVAIDGSITGQVSVKNLLVIGGITELLDKLIEPLVLGQTPNIINDIPIMRYAIAHPSTFANSSINYVSSRVLPNPGTLGVIPGATIGLNTVGAQNNFILKWFDSISVWNNQNDDLKYSGALCLLQGIMKKIELLHAQGRRLVLSALFNRAVELYKVVYNEYRRYKSYLSRLTSLPGKPWLRVPLGKWLSGESGIPGALHPKTAFKKFTNSNVPYIKKRALEELHYHWWIYKQIKRPETIAFGLGWTAGKTGALGKTIRHLPGGAKVAARVGGFITRHAGRAAEKTGEGLEWAGGKPVDPRTKKQKLTEELAKEQAEEKVPWGWKNIFRSYRGKSEEERKKVEKETKRLLWGVLTDRTAGQKQTDSSTPSSEPVEENPVVVRPKASDETVVQESVKNPDVDLRTWEDTGENVGGVVRGVYKAVTQKGKEVSGKVVNFIKGLSK